VDTGKQSKIIDTFLSMISDDEKLIYQPIVRYLSELGYKPQRQKSQGYVISFKHPLHGKQIAKIGIREKNQSVYFSLRFSACTGYSQKFIDVVRDVVISSNQYIPICDTCKLCKGDTHVYTYEFPSGEKTSRCGSYAYEIPNVTADDTIEIKKLLKEQHEYFMIYAV